MLLLKLERQKNRALIFLPINNLYNDEFFKQELYHEVKCKNTKHINLWLCKFTTELPFARF
jgi:hypothetical protein